VKFILGDRSPSCAPLLVASHNSIAPFDQVGTLR
jgi:hypothetical protein